MKSKPQELKSDSVHFFWKVFFLENTPLPPKKMKDKNIPKAGILDVNIQLKPKIAEPIRVEYSLIFKIF